MREITKEIMKQKQYTSECLLYLFVVLFFPNCEKNALNPLGEGFLVEFSFFSH